LVTPATLLLIAQRLLRRVFAVAASIVASSPSIFSFAAAAARAWVVHS
jgi:hypothetical protein